VIQSLLNLVEEDQGKSLNQLEKIKVLL